MEQTKLDRFKRISLISATTILLFIFIFFWFGLNQSCTAKPIKIENVDYDVIDEVENEPIIYDTLIRTKENVSDELIVEVNKYIKTKTNNHHKFIPKYIVNAGLTYDIDICFIMAQTQIETLYGTKGAGRDISRRSLFGIAISRYSNYEQAIDAYCKLLQKSYLGKGKTEQHLLTKYVTFRGARYASNPNYEKELRTAYNHIKKNTHIYQLQQEYKNID